MHCLPGHNLISQYFWSSCCMLSLGNKGREESPFLNLYRQCHILSWRIGGHCSKSSECPDHRGRQIKFKNNHSERTSPGGRLPGGGGRYSDPERGSWDEIRRLCPECYNCLHFPWETENLGTLLRSHNSNPAKACLLRGVLGLNPEPPT